MTELYRLTRKEINKVKKKLDALCPNHNLITIPVLAEVLETNPRVLIEAINELKKEGKLKRMKDEQYGRKRNHDT